VQAHHEQKQSRVQNKYSEQGRRQGQACRMQHEHTIFRSKVELQRTRHTIFRAKAEEAGEIPGGSAETRV